MYFLEIVKRLTIDIFTLLAIVLNCLFLYFQMLPFARAAFLLHMLNVQTVTFMIFTLLMLILPIVMLFKGDYFPKKNVLSVLFYLFAAVILIGTAADLISFRGFSGYTYSEGDAVFVNIMWNIPSLAGVGVSILIAALYCVLANKIKHVRRASLILLLTVFILSSAIPFAYAYFFHGILPRQTWLEKAAFIIPEYILLLVAFSVSASSRKLWVKHIW